VEESSCGVCKIILRSFLTEKPQVLNEPVAFFMRHIIKFLTIFLLAPISFSFASDKLNQRELADLKRIQETNNQILADTVQAVNAIRNELQEIKGAIEENRHFVQEGSANNEKLLREYDYRLTGVEERITLLVNQVEEVASRSVGVKKAAASDEEAALYRRAMAEINVQNYKAAITLFNQFLQKYPKSTLADNAQYWKGESLYASKDFPNAIIEFQKVVKKYPRSEKIPAAVLKQGYCFFESKEYLDAKAFLQKVIQDYPKSEEAALAKERIQKINQILAKLPPPSSTQPAKSQRNH